jgi:hypothetical protein
MTTSLFRLIRIALLVTAAVLSPVRSFAQLPTIAPATRNAALAAVQKEFAGQLAAATTDADKRAVYRQMFEALITNESLYPTLTQASYRDALAKDASRVYTAQITGVGAELRESAISPSVNAPLSNPAANGLIERSGATELIALAADLRSLFASDGSAVTLNLNAVALFRGTTRNNINAGAQYLYAQHENWRRLTGSVTFGAKIPEKDLSGFSGFPNPNQLFDAIAWDVKVRAIGDRDPRASQWYGLFIGRMGTITELAPIVATHPSIPTQDAIIAAEAANDVLGQRLSIAANQVANSLLVSVKTSGQHLTQEAGRNKYEVAVMVDKGFANVDFTANATFSSADAPAMEATDPFKTKDWQLSAALTGSVLKDALVNGRAAELSGSFSGIISMDDADIPIDRKNVFRLNATLTLPFMDKAKIPLSFTYSNDPNNLEKEKYVTGQIGVSYDFGAIWSALK